MNLKVSLDRYLTSGQPEDPIDLWFDDLGNRFSDEWFDKHGAEFLQHESKIDQVAVGLFYKGHTPERAKDIIQRIFK